jgi:hypothetical protein
MAFVILNEPYFWPRPNAGLRDPSNGAITLSAASTKLALCIRSPLAGSLTGVRFCFGTITTPQDMTFALDGITSTLVPDDVEGQTATYTPVGGDANTVKTIVFGSSRALAQGELFAVVIRWTSTTGQIQLGLNTSGAATEVWSCWGRTFVGGVWSLSTSTNRFALSLDWANGEHAPVLGTSPVPGVRTNINAGIVVNNGTTPDEVGNRIRLPLNGALSAFYAFSATAGNGDLKLYDSASNVLASVSIATPGSGLSIPQDFLFVPLARPIPVTAGAVVRVTFTPTDGTSTTVPRAVVDSNARLAAMPGGGDINCFRTERTDGGAWTDTNTERLGFGVAYSAIDDGTGPAQTSWMPQGKIIGEEPPIILPSW